jgi:peptidoglycan-associated lipoprotein
MVMNTHKSLALAAAPIAASLLLFSAGCGSSPKKDASTPAPKAVPAYSITTTTGAETKPVSPSISVSDEIAEACDLHFENVASAPKFEFDRAELLEADHDVLQVIAACVTTGPLKGMGLRLVGRADPRGPEQYNLALGARRAASVARYLAPLGVEPERLNQTSRGELDAKGFDEATWQLDRRVDIHLAH